VPTLPRRFSRLFRWRRTLCRKAVVHRTIEEVWYFTSGHGHMWRRLGECEEVVEVDPAYRSASRPAHIFSFAATVSSLSWQSGPRCRPGRARVKSLSSEENGTQPYEHPSSWFCAFGEGSCRGHLNAGMDWATAHGRYRVRRISPAQRSRVGKDLFAFPGGQHRDDPRNPQIAMPRQPVGVLVAPNSVTGTEFGSRPASDSICRKRGRITSASPSGPRGRRSEPSRHRSGSRGVRHAGSAADEDRRVRRLHRLRPCHHLGKIDHVAVIFGLGFGQISFIASMRSRISLKRVLNSVRGRPSPRRSSRRRPRTETVRLRPDRSRRRVSPSGSDRAAARDTPRSPA